MGETIQRPSIPESFNVLVKELQALGLRVELLKFKDEVAPEERVTMEPEEAVPVAFQSRVEAEEEGEEAVPVSDRISELSEVVATTEQEDEEEVVAGIEEGAAVDASGEDAKSEMKDAVSEDAMNDA
jgi:hypothetical protein